MNQFYPQQREKQKDPEFKNPKLCGRLNLAKSWALSYLDILFYQNLAKPIQGSGKVDETSLSAWFSQVAIHLEPKSEFC
jgi:hypothetical protein